MGSLHDAYQDDIDDAGDPADAELLEYEHTMLRNSSRSRLDGVRDRDELVVPPDAWDRREDPEVRDLIILANWPMLTKVVGRLRQGLPPHVKVEEDDLRSFGVIGLYKAMERYDPALGFAFDKFASNFIRGAVLDALRAQDWAPRSLRKRQRDMENAKTLLRDRLQRPPTDEELAEELRWTTHDISNTRKQVDAAWPRSLDEIRGAAEKDLYTVVADATGSPEQHVLGTHDSHENDRSTLLTDRMASFIDSMPAQKKAVAIFCYYLDMKQGDVAIVLGVPESRVSNLHLAIMEDIHSRLADLLTMQDDLN